MKYAVIIKHPGRDWDYRVDMVETDLSVDEIIKQIEREMLGPFEVIAITERVSNRTLKPIDKGSETHR